MWMFFIANIQVKNKTLLAFYKLSLFPPLQLFCFFLKCGDGMDLWNKGWSRFWRDGAGWHTILSYYAKHLIVWSECVIFPLIISDCSQPHITKTWKQTSQIGKGPLYILSKISRCLLLGRGTIFRVSGISGFQNPKLYCLLITLSRLPIMMPKKERHEIFSPF